MTRRDLVVLAMKGAESELAKLEEQAAPLRELLARGPRPGRNGKAPTLGRSRSTMSLAARRAISARMKAMWAAKRAQKEKAPRAGKGQRGSKSA